METKILIEKKFLRSIHYALINDDQEKRDNIIFEIDKILRHHETDIDDDIIMMISDHMGFLYSIDPDKRFDFAKAVIDAYTKFIE